MKSSLHAISSLATVLSLQAAHECYLCTLTTFSPSEIRHFFTLNLRTLLLIRKHAFEKFLKKTFKTTLVLMLISKNERSPTASNQWTFFNLKLTWPYVIMLSFDFRTTKSPGFLPISQASHVPFPLPIQLLYIRKIHILSLVSNFVLLIPFPEIPSPLLFSPLCKANCYSSFRCHLNITISDRTCINPQSKIVCHIVFFNLFFIRV